MIRPLSNFTYPLLSLSDGVYCSQDNYTKPVLLDFNNAIVFGTSYNKPQITTPLDGIVFVDAGHGRGFDVIINGNSISIAEHAILIPVPKGTTIKTEVSGNIFVPYAY